MKKPTFVPFYILMFTEVMAANMVHPVTPSFLTALGMPDQMFGAAFAAMSLTNFWLCPFWGRVGDLYGRVKTMSLTIVLYAVGQFLFLRSTTAWQIILARLFSGAFSGGTTVCLMAYGADTVGEERCGRQMAICAAMTSAGTAAGYLVGGVLGDFSVETAFLWQIALLVLSALGMLLFLKDGACYHRSSGGLLASLDPFSPFRGFFLPPRLYFCSPFSWPALPAPPMTMPLIIISRPNFTSHPPTMVSFTPPWASWDWPSI